MAIVEYGVAQYLQTSDERSDGFEIRLKSSLFDHKLTLNIAAFYQKFKIMWTSRRRSRPALRVSPALSIRVPRRCQPMAIRSARGVEVRPGSSRRNGWISAWNATYADAD
ncbi:hypothetical protein [Sphingobium sp.]|uniref:hypothetical protein n=1 Tax=Sphingobium sp. TaxID=1912891 RepID=UPI0035C7492C